MCERSEVTYCTHHEHAEVRRVSRHAEHGGLEIPLVARQVDERNHFGGLFANLHPVQCSVVWLVHYVTWEYTDKDLD